MFDVVTVGAQRPLVSGTVWQLLTLCVACSFCQVHITSMSTEHPYNVGSSQYDWVEADLAKAAANRANVPWIILTGASTELHP